MIPTEPPAVRSALIVGCGDIGRRLGRVLRHQGLIVTGLVRTPDSAAELRAEGLAARMADLDAEPAVPLWSPSEAAPHWLFWFAPPPDRGTGDPRILRALAALPSPPRRLIYLSTSAVYGDCGGAWIDEDAPLAPASDRGRRRLAAEAAVRDYAATQDVDALILRVPGIYGPGRLPLQRLREGRPVLRIDESPCTNRIHADDLAAAAHVVADRGAAGAAYNVSDGSPTTMTDYLLRCAELLGLPPPPQVDPETARRAFSPMLLSFLDESKRLRTDRLRALGWSPRYPDLAQGLPSCLPA